MKGISMTEIDRDKQTIREHIWAALEHAGVVEPDVYGYIPDFDGADQAAGRLAAAPAWHSAHVVKVVPDRAQLPVRVRALRDLKLVYMAVPKLATVNPFLLLDPHTLAADPSEAADREAAARIAEPIDTDRMQPIDLIVCGSVAVNHLGARLGKGAGYSDIEVALLTEAGLIGDNTVIATTVHDLQVVEENLPELPHDFRVDLIVTPSRVIRCPRSMRPGGLQWNDLTAEKINSIPALQTRLRDRRKR